MGVLTVTLVVRTPSSVEPSSWFDTRNRMAQNLPVHGEPVRPLRCSPQSNTTVLLPEDELPIFEANLYALCKAKRDREAIAEALDYFDDRLIARQFTDCNRALHQLQVAKLASSVMVSILGITIRAKSKSRAIFFERAFQEIARLKGKKYAIELLAKYR
jgi:hypothetical protein